MKYPLKGLARIKAWLWSGFFYATLGYTQHISQNYPITINAIKTHVAFLSSDNLAGRLTGSSGEKLATQYTANIFQHLGLEPAGDNGTFFQQFAFTGGVVVGKRNLFSITTSQGIKKNLILDKDWRSLSFSSTKDFECNELVFAGYGMRMPAIDKKPAYDSYHGLNVVNKCVIVFRYIPEKINADIRQQMMRYASLRYKTFLAKKNGAKAIIFVSGPNSKVKNELIPLSLVKSFTNAGIIAISVKDKVVNELLESSTYPFNSLQKLQDRLDTGQLNPTLILSKIKIAGQIDLQPKIHHGRNVLAKLSIGKTAAPMMIISAHIDHLGRGELINSRSGSNESNLIHYGADDNASGVAAVLETAIKLSRLKAQGRLHGHQDILFALWSGEELGLLGSTHFIKNFMDQTGNKVLRPAINLCLNLDMVGRLRKNLILQGTGSSSSWLNLIAQVNKKHALPLILQNDPYLPTDSTIFYLHGIPTLNFFTGSHDEYHTPRDKLNSLNVAGIKIITTFLVDLVMRLETDNNLLTYQRIEKVNNQSGRGFRVYLGTIPDYASANKIGVKLSGVTKNSPADHANLRQNDVIVELAGQKIHDIYDYSFVLSGLRAGEPVALVVLRGQERLTLKIVAQSRE